MNPLMLFIGVALFISGIVLGRQSESPSSKIFGFGNSSQQESPTETPKPSETPVITITSMPTESVHPTSSPKASTTPKPTSQPASSSRNLSDFKYPASSVTTDTSEKLVLSSNDSPSAITTWYENRIKELGYSSRASAKTNSNGNVLNKLGAGKNNSSVNIEIKKTPNEGSTTIIVTSGSDSGSDVHVKIENNVPSM